MEHEGDKAVAKWKQISSDFAAQIRTGVLPVGSRLLPEEEIAVQYGVSRPTANRALNELAKQGYVVRKPKIGTIVAEAKPPTKHSIALIADRVAFHLDFPQAEFIAGIQEVLGGEYSLALFDSSGEIAKEVRHIRKAAATTDGIILYPTCNPKNNSVLDWAKQTGVPLVLVDRSPDGEDLPAVLPDEVSATRDAVELMIERGHKRIAFVSFDKPEVSSVRKRHEAYLAAISAHGLPAIERFLPRDLEIMDKARASYIRDMVFALHRGAEEATGFFCVQDSLALGVLDSCEGLSISCPGTVEIACFNEWPPMLLGRPWNIHRIVRRKREMGRVAAQKLMAQINKTPYEAVSHIGATIFTADPSTSPTSASGLSDWILNSIQHSNL